MTSLSRKPWQSTSSLRSRNTRRPCWSWRSLFASFSGTSWFSWDPWMTRGSRLPDGPRLSRRALRTNNSSGASRPGWTRFTLKPKGGLGLRAVNNWKYADYNLLLNNRTSFPYVGFEGGAFSHAIVQSHVNRHDVAYLAESDFAKVERSAAKLGKISPNLHSSRRMYC